MKSSRLGATARSLVFALLAMLLTACGAMHPGDAAVVDGTAISMAKADQTAVAYCALSTLSARKQGVTKLNAGDSRRRAVSDLVTHIVAQRVAKKKGIEPDPNSYELSRDQKRQVAAAFKGADIDQIVDVIEMIQETSAITVALGERATGTTITPTNAKEVRKAGQSKLAEAIQHYDVDIDNRFGINDVTVRTDKTGSLSVDSTGKKMPDAGQLPVSQRCA